VLVIVLVAVPGCAGRWGRDAARDEGLRLASQGNFAKAEPLLVQSLERHPDDVPVIRALTLGYLAAKNGAQADIYLARWCELRPGEPEPFERRMEMSRERKRLELAIADGQHLLTLTPDNNRLRRRVGQWLIEFNRLDEGERECRACLERDPHDVEAKYLLGIAYQRQGEGKKAAAILDPLIAEHPEMTGALLIRAQVYFDANQPDKAIPLLRRVVAADPQRKTAKYYLGLALSRTGQTDEARRYLAESQEP
jgi:tetratricopeptide (TPR) repeat protein